MRTHQVPFYTDQPTWSEIQRLENEETNLRLLETAQALGSVFGGPPHWQTLWLAHPGVALSDIVRFVGTYSDMVRCDLIETEEYSDRHIYIPDLELYEVQSFRCEKCGGRKSVYCRCDVLEEEVA